MNKPQHKNKYRKNFRRNRFEKKRQDLFENLIPLKDAQLAQLKSTYMENEFIVFDIESTGGNPEKNGITEIAALQVKNGEIVGRFYSMVNPQVRIPPIVRKMTGIDQNMVKNAPLIDEIMPKLLEFIGDRILVSHNIIGDLKFLRYFAKQTVDFDMPNLFLCTHLLSERVFPQSPNKSLTGLAQYLGLEIDKVHRAQEDADITLYLFKAILAEVDKLPLGSLEDVIRYQRDLESAMRLGWPFSPAVIQNVPKRPGVVVLKDGCEEVLFVCAASHLSRLMAFLRRYNQLPRQILRLLLRSKHLTCYETRNYFEALMLEARLLAKQPTLADPQLWRQRYVNVLSLRKKDGLFVAKVEPFSSHLDHGFGPASDIAKYSGLLQTFAEKHNVQYSAKGITLSPEQASDLMAVISRNVDEVLSAHRLRISHLWQPKQFIAHLRRRKEIAKIRAMQPAQGLENVLDLHGFLAVHHHQQGRCSIYEIRESVPVSHLELEGDAAQVLANFNTADFHKSKLHTDYEDTIYVKRSVAWFVLQKGALFKKTSS